MAEVKIVNRVTGKLETLPLEEADKRVAADRDFDYPSREEIDRIERNEQFGSTGQQATAAVETVGRVGTFGAWQGFGSQTEIDARRKTLGEQSPGTAFVAQAVGSTIPAVAGGAVGGAVAGAAGLTGRAAGALSLIGEGAAGGLADEVEQAAVEGRDVSPGRAMLVGVGGELVGRAIPAAVKAGVGKLRGAPTAAAAVAGETVEDVSEAVAKKADAKLAEAAPDLPPGPARDDALAKTAPAQRARADAELQESAARAAPELEKIAADAPRVLEKQIDGTSPGQIRWAAETAASLREMAGSLPEAQARLLNESADALLEAKSGKSIWRAAADARKQLREMKATERALAPPKAKGRPPAVPDAPAPEAPAVPPAPTDAPAAKAAPAPIGGIERNAAGARAWRATPDSDPDFSDWDLSDFARGKGGGNAAGKLADDYSGGAKLGQYQRSIVDGIKQNAAFKETGRVAGDAGKLGSEPTFVLMKDGSVALKHGKLRITAAREVGRDTVYGKVVSGVGKNPKVVFEGQIRVGRGPRATGAEVPPPGGAAPVGGAPPELPTSAAAAAPTPEPLSEADKLLATGQADVGVWGKAGEGAADLQRAAEPGPGAAARDPVSALEDQVAAAERWQVGKPEARAKLKAEAGRMRSASELKADVDKAEAGRAATGRGKKEPESFARMAAAEAGEFLLEKAVGTAVPGAGLALRGAKMLWNRLDDQGKAQIQRVARTMLSPLASQGKWGAARAATVMTALDRFKGESPDARSAYESRRQMLTDVVASPQLAGQAMANALGGLAAEHPSNYVGLSRRMTESLQYVAHNLPATVGVSLAYPTGIPITDSELKDVADLWNTAFEPATALDDIALRQASPVQMKTLREVHPDLYQDIQREITMQASTSYQQMDSQTKLSIDIMFGTDGAAGPFASSEAARYISQAEKRAAKQPMGGQQLDPDQTAATVEASGINAVRTGVTNKGAV